LLVAAAAIVCTCRQWVNALLTITAQENYLAAPMRGYPWRQIVPEHQSEKTNGPGSLNKELWLEALDLLEREFRAFKRRDAHLRGASASGALTLIDADVKRTQRLLLNLAG
jgi:hypothetical protein